MRKSVFVTALLLAALVPLHAFSQQKQPLEGRASYTRMQQVAEGQYKETVGKMNHTYNMLAEMLDPPGIAKLNEAQTAWKKFSEAECRFTTDYSRGEPLEKMLFQDCLTSMTEDRNVALEYQLRRNFTLDPSLAFSRQKK